MYVDTKIIEIANALIIWWSKYMSYSYFKQIRAELLVDRNQLDTYNCIEIEVELPRHHITQYQIRWYFDAFWQIDKRKVCQSVKIHCPLSTSVSRPFMVDFKLHRSTTDGRNLEHKTDRTILPCDWFYMLNKKLLQKCFDRIWWLGWLTLESSVICDTLR